MQFSNDSDTLLALIYQVLQTRFGNSGGPVDDIRSKQTDEKFDLAALKNEYINELIRNSFKPVVSTPLPPVFSMSNITDKE